MLILISISGIAQNEIRELYKQAGKAFQAGRHDDALITDLKALKLAEQSKNCLLIAEAYLQVGGMYYYNKDKPQALAYFFKSLRYIDSCRIDSMKYTICYNIGTIYFELGKTDSAILFLEKSKYLIEKTHDYAALSKLNAVIAELFFPIKEKLITAEMYVGKAEKYAILSRDKSTLAFAAIKRGMLCDIKKDYSKALDNYKLALKYYEETRIPEGKLYAMRYALNDMLLLGSKDASDYLGKYIDIKDSIYRAEGASKVAQYKTIYETEKKETENKLLQQQNQLDQVEISTKNKTIICLVIGVLLIIMILFWRLSVINLKKKNRELDAARDLQKEKERISRDLHDNVGGQLSYVLYALEGFNQEDKVKRMAVTKNINDSVRSVISNLRETIWAINDEAISINDFSDKFKVYVRAMFKTTDTQISFHEQIHHNVRLNSLTGLNLYRICQEIMHNAFKHSKATTIEVCIIADKKVTIVISDNGIGFDIENRTGEGFGLANIKSRANEAGIALNLEAEMNKGVTYTLIV